MSINRSIFPYERMGRTFSGGDVTTEVASLSDIKEPDTNVIYKVPTYTGFNKNYIFGQEFDILSVESTTESFMTELGQFLISKGIEADNVQSVLFLLLYGLATVNVIEDEAMSINMYDNGKYIFKNNIISQMIGQEEPIDKTFDTIDEVYNFVTELLNTEKLQSFVSVLKQYNLEYKYTTEPLNDENLFLNVVEKAGDTTYKYYIRNGEKYNEVGGDTGLKIIKVEPGTFVGNTHTVDLNRAITLDELELLKNNEAVLAIGKASTIGDKKYELYDYLFNPSVSVIGDTIKLGYFHGRSLLDQPSIANSIGTNFILSSEKLDELKWYNYENNELVLQNQNFNKQVSSIKKLLALYKNTADSNEIVDLYLPSAIKLAYIVYLNNQFNFYDGNDFSSEIQDQIITDGTIKHIQINLLCKINNISSCYSCVMSLYDNENSNKKGIITIYDTSDNKVTYVEISGINLLSGSGSITVKAYKDGAEITTDFLTNTLNSIYIYGL